MKLLIAGLALTALGCSAFTAQANNIGWKNAANTDINWNYVSAGYARATIKNVGPDNIDLNGYQLIARHLLSDNLYLHASYYDVSGDVDIGNELDMSELLVGLGLRQAVSKNIDSFIEAGYLRTETKAVGIQKHSMNGFMASAGFRYLIVHNLELAAALRYNDGSSTSSSTFGDISARYSITPTIDLYINYQFDSNASLLGTGIALNF